MEYRHLRKQLSTYLTIEQTHAPILDTHLNLHILYTHTNMYILDTDELGLVAPDESGLAGV